MFVTYTSVLRWKEPDLWGCHRPQWFLLLPTAAWSNRMWQLARCRAPSEFPDLMPRSLGSSRKDPLSPSSWSRKEESGKYCVDSFIRMKIHFILIFFFKYLAFDRLKLTYPKILTRIEKNVKITWFENQIVVCVCFFFT